MTIRVKHMIEAIDENLKTVSVIFPNANGDFMDSTKAYVYKTYKEFIPGDMAVVKVNSNYKVVKIVEAHSTPAINFDSETDYKWIVSKVPVEEHEELLAKQEEIEGKLRKLYSERAKKSFREQVLADLNLTSQELLSLGFKASE